MANQPLYLPVSQPPQFLISATAPLAYYLNLPLLPAHIHIVLLFLLFYSLLFSHISPLLSRHFFPLSYPGSPNYKATHFKTSQNTAKLHWDVALVSLVQSSLVSLFAAYLIIFDPERSQRNWAGRIWGCSEGEGVIGAVALGYFIWHFVAMIYYRKAFGLPLVAHGVVALFVGGVAFRPFVPHYLPIFLLYELSNPFLDIHRFLGWTGHAGSRAESINGILLVVVFTLCRPVWGTYQTLWMVSDELKAWKVSRGREGLFDIGLLTMGRAEEVEHVEPVPGWLVGCHLLCGVVLLGLNYWWFGLILRKAFKGFGGNRKAKTV